MTEPTHHATPPVEPPSPPPKADDFFDRQREQLFADIEATRAASVRRRTLLVRAGVGLFVAAWLMVGLPHLAMAGGTFWGNVGRFFASASVPLFVGLLPAAAVLAVYLLIRAATEPGRRREELQMAMLAGIERQVEQLRRDIDELRRG